jgi:PAS domain S-box-containing protein
MSEGDEIVGVPPPSETEAVFPGRGEMVELCRAFDWASTSLGPPEAWPQSLRSTVALVLNCRNPMFLWWGPDLVQIYNDAYRPSFGQTGRHPQALGMRARDCWTDIWDTIGPQIEQVMGRGEGTWHEDQYLPIERDGKLDDVWWTYSYSPVFDDDGAIAGTLVVCLETTKRVLSERERERMLAVTARTEHRLRESEARLRAIFDGTYEYIGLLDLEGTLLEANRASLEFADSARDDVVGRPFWEGPWFAHTPGAAEAMREAVGRAAAGEFVRYEAQLRRPSAEPMFFDVSLHPVRDAHGRVVLIVPEGRDTTARHRIEDALSESEARYRSLFESLDEGFCVIEVLFDDEDRAVDYVFLEANPAFVNQTALTNAVGKRMRELVPDHDAHWFETYGRVALSGVGKRFEAPAEAMGRWYDAYAFRVGRPEERRVAILFKDISAAKAAEREREQLLAALEVERARLAEVFRRAPSFLAVLRGRDHVFELANDAYYGVVGHRELIGKPLIEALPEVGDQGFVEILDEVMETGVPFVGREIPIHLARSPGSSREERFVDFVYQPLTEADGSRSGIVAHGSDVTEQVLARREVERLLEESERARAEADSARLEAEAANRAKSEFLAVMSHELRTPLNAIGGYAELMEMGIRGPITPQQREDLRRLQGSQHHLLGLINEVLNYAKLETGSVQYDLEDVPLSDALSAAELLISPQARAKGLTVIVGECPPSALARADAEKLRQILANLLSNAVKFTGSGGRIEMSCRQTDGSVTVVVRDTGIGIPADKLDGIFDPFVQVRADLTRPHEGTGLGLAISRDLARGMGGELVVESRVGEGSAFSLTLARSAAGAGRQRSEVSSGPTAPSP